MPSKRILLLASLCSALLSSNLIASPREKLDFDANWLFYRGDSPDAKPGELSYKALRDYELGTTNDFTKGEATARPSGNIGDDVSFVKPDFADGSWRKLNLPHDWAIEGPFDINLPGETGKLPYAGVAWYRKHFTLPSEDSGKQLFLGIDGAMSYSTVWVNGQFVGGWPYGYSSYELELTPYLKFGQENVVAIRLDNPPDSSRWYPGAGIYRNVWLTKTSPVHVAHWGTYITTPTVAADSAAIDLKFSIQNESKDEAKATVATQIFELDPQDRRGASPVTSLGSIDCTIPAGQTGTGESTGKVSSPKLWDTQNPTRYVAVTQVSVKGQVVDEYETPFGIRSIRFDVAQGFLLNGKKVPLNGVCDHHDMGAIGAAFNYRASQRQLEILKEMGVNALRTSHNMPTPELLELCDKMGILVMDESFDCWMHQKKSGDYHNIFEDWYERDLRAEYRRDRNHPSVILWSVGNEIPGQGKGDTIPVIARMSAIAHDEDPTRPVTQASNGGMGYDPNYVKYLDVFGENYDPGMYPKFRAKYPQVPLYGSETSSTVSSRGIYYFASPTRKEDKCLNFQVTSYDTFHPGWASLPDPQFKALEQYPYTAGEFVWTGFDYLGEPTPYNSDPTNLLNFQYDPAQQAAMEAELKQLKKIRSPSRSSYFGIVDLCGFKKDRFYLYQAHWRPDFPMVHLLPHWNWAGREGQKTPVYAYSSGDEVELFLNGQSLGKMQRKPFEYRFIWPDVAYAPGELKAVAYKNGQKWAETSVKTTGPAAAVQLQPDRGTIANDGKDLCFVTTEIHDSTGLTVPTAQDHLTFSIKDGPGEIVATDNGDATDLHIFSLPERNAFNGMALAIVRAKGPGTIHLVAQADGLKAGECTIEAK